MSSPYRTPPATPYRAPARGSWRCPRCDAGLIGEEHAGAKLEVCTRCHGVFVAHAVLRDAIERDGVVDELRAVLPRTPSKWAEGGPMYVKCPVCEVLMNRKQYATGARVVVDVCKHHGSWFDAGELPRVLDFVAGGGLAQAARRDAARDRERDQRERLHREPAPLDRDQAGVASWLEAILWGLL